MGSFEPVREIFNRLDDWRRLPSYQLERRADILFAAYLPEFLSGRLGIRLNPKLIPEFPLHLKTIDFGCANNQSVKVDYLAVAEDLSRVFFIEFKTDLESRGKTQDDYLEKASGLTMGQLLEGIRSICKVTQSRPKYCYLLQLLHDVGLIKLPPRCGSVESSIVKMIDFEVPANNQRPVIWYLQPPNGSQSKQGIRPGGKSNEITLDEFAEWLVQFEDPFSLRFQESLRIWYPTLQHDT